MICRGTQSFAQTSVTIRARPALTAIGEDDGIAGRYGTDDGERKKAHSKYLSEVSENHVSMGHVGF